MNERKKLDRTIRTEYIYPPIPIRTRDWVAWVGEEREPGAVTGWGETELEAVKDLVAELEGRGEE